MPSYSSDIILVRLSEVLSCRAHLDRKSMCRMEAEVLTQWPNSERVGVLPQNEKGKCLKPIGDAVGEHSKRHGHTESTMLCDDDVISAGKWTTRRTGFNQHRKHWLSRNTRQPRRKGAIYPDGKLIHVANMRLEHRAHCQQDVTHKYSDSKNTYAVSCVPQCAYQLHGQDCHKITFMTLQKGH